MTHPEDIEGHDRGGVPPALRFVEWHHVAPGFSAECSVVEGDIVSTRCEGTFEPAHLGSLVESFERFFVSRMPPRSRYYLHLDSARLKGAEPVAREMYRETLIDWHERHPFELHVISGAPATLRACARLARESLPFPLFLVARAEEVLPLVKRFASGRTPAGSGDGAGRRRGPVDDLLEYVRSMRWQETGWPEPPVAAMDGPLAPIYDALILIKESIDGLVDAAKIEHEYRKLILDLHKDVNRLRRADRERREFVEDAFHDIRTPLALLQLQLEDLEARIENAGRGGLSLETRALNRSIRSLSQRFSRVLDLSRLDARRRIERPEPFLWPELARDVAQGLSPAAARNSVALSVRPGRGMPRVVGDIALVERATENLLVNAIRHSPSGSTVDVGFDATDRELRMEVRDHGAGIPTQDLSHLFERFYRASTEGHRGEGSGLGLAIVRRIAELHGGRVFARNANDGGAVFSLGLPLDPRPSR